jgi:hypothetical protein
MRSTYRYRSFFWPAILILAGIVALLVNTGRIPVDRLYSLVNLWPVILVVIGLELIIRRTLHGLAADIAAALVVLIAVVGVAAYITVAPNPAATHTYDSAADLGTIDQVALAINVGGATINVGSTTDTGQLYRAHIEYSGAQPKVQFDPAAKVLRIDQQDRGFSILPARKFALTLQLNPGVRWSIEANSGAATITMNLAQIRATSLSLNTGASQEEITLGPATGIVPVEINGGALTAHFHRPSGTEASVEVSGGALSLDADGRGMRAIGHLSYASTGFSGAGDGYRIEVNGGACTVSLDTKPESG